MKRFPESVRKAMRSGGAATTCLPVQLDGGAWESALFFELGGAECKADRRALTRARGPVAVGMESDVVETDFGAVVTLRAEVHTQASDAGAPLAGEVLLLPGEGGTHFETLDLLTRQPRLAWFFGDQQHWMLHSQSHPLGAEQHEAFRELLKDAARHDAVVRMTARYDAQAALGEVVRHYELRQRGAPAPPWTPSDAKAEH